MPYHYTTILKLLTHEITTLNRYYVWLVIKKDNLREPTALQQQTIGTVRNLLQ